MLRARVCSLFAARRSFFSSQKNPWEAGNAKHLLEGDSQGVL
jgi:hypothetical protein